MREQIEKRPAVLLFLGLICGLAVAMCPASLAVVAAIGAAVRSLSARLILVFSFVLGGLFAPREVPLILAAVPLHRIGTVATVPKLYNDHKGCIVSVDGRLLILTCGPKSSPVLGDDIRLSGIERPISSAGEGAARLLGVEGSIEQEKVEVVRRGSVVAQLADRWRSSFVELMDQNLDSKNSTLLDSVCFNASSLMEPNDRQELEQSGLIHIVTASGLQIFVLAFFLGGLFWLAPIPRVAQFALLCCLLIAYTIASGLNPAIVRAVAMSVAAMASCWLQRDPDPLSAMAIVGCGYLLWKPISVFNPGFQLSYAVVAAVCLFYRRIRFEAGAKCLGDLIKESLRGTVVILVASVPLSAYYFGSVSVLSVVSNALICVSLPLLVMVGFLAFIVSGVSVEVAGEILRHFAGPVSESIRAVMGWFGSGIGSVEVPAFSGYWLLLFYAAWAMTYRRRVAQP